jgi:hypothetical protein
MWCHRSRVGLTVGAAAALLALAAGPATATTVPAKAKKSCALLEQSEITAAFQTEAGEGTQQGSDCTWQVGELALSLELTTKDAKSTFEALRDLAADAGSRPERIRGIRDRAVFAEIESFKELLILKGKKLLFLRVLDIASPIDTAVAKAALTDLGKRVSRRA